MNAVLVLPFFLGTRENGQNFCHGEGHFEALDDTLLHGSSHLNNHVCLAQTVLSVFSTFTLAICFRMTTLADTRCSLVQALRKIAKTCGVPAAVQHV